MLSLGSPCVGIKAYTWEINTVVLGGALLLPSAVLRRTKSHSAPLHQMSGVALSQSGAPKPLRRVLRRGPGESPTMLSPTWKSDSSRNRSSPLSDCLGTWKIGKALYAFRLGASEQLAQMLCWVMQSWNSASGLIPSPSTMTKSPRIL